MHCITKAGWKRNICIQDMPGSYPNTLFSADLGKCRDSPLSQSTTASSNILSERWDGDDM
jgi:hypothetical protein